MKYRSTSKTSDIHINLPAPADYPAGESPYGAIAASDLRSVSAVDVNGDGYLDIFMHPSYFNYGPALAPVVLINDGKGGFTDGTASVFPTLPKIAQSNNVFFQDFNGDGRVDMFVIDQGLEFHGTQPGYWPGGQNQLWLQTANGTFVDATATLAQNAGSFNHISSIGDVNGDGNADIVVTRLGGFVLEGSGTFFYLGDGKGGFTFSTAGLPDEIKYLPVSQRDWNTKTIDYQFSGTNGIGDLNGDGRNDLVAGSYVSGDQLTNKNTVRGFEQQAGGQFVQKWSVAQPDALNSWAGPMGAAGITIADLDHDGKNDVVVLWEKGSKTAVEILHNTGNNQFVDVTTAWLGSYLQRDFGTDSAGDTLFHYYRVAVQDLDRDGNPDLFLKTFGISGAQFASGSNATAFAYLNDGTGHMTASAPTANGQTLSGAQWATMMGDGINVLGFPLMFDADNDGNTDTVFIESFHNLDQSVNPYRVTTLHVSTLFGTDSQHVYRAGDLGERLVGTSAADSFYGGKGVDTFVGGAGVDTVVYSGALANYSIKAGAAGFTVSAKTGSGGADSMSGIERLQLADTSVALVDAKLADTHVTRAADGSLSIQATGAAAYSLQNISLVYLSDAALRFDTAGVGGQAYRVYQAAFNRTPDLGGLGFWISAMEHGSSLATVADGFVNSKEFRDVYGAAPSNHDIVDKFYQNVLHRPGEAAGIDFWVGLLDKHAISVTDALVGFSESAENQAGVIGVITNGIPYAPFG
jgi:hypothetical protein